MRVVGALAVAALLVAAVPASAKPSIHLRGTAYAFNGPAVITRASIRVAELPRVRATTQANGAYDLVVPDHARVTPYIVAPGYHTIKQFRAFGAHGVAGATASSTPALPSPIYFNENVVPDPSQPASSKDGGVIWTEVPPGGATPRRPASRASWPPAGRAAS
jgi:hypothetical protein